jgi:hypothetical protein
MNNTLNAVYSFLYTKQTEYSRKLANQNTYGIEIMKAIIGQAASNCNNAAIYLGGDINTPT